LINGWNFGLIDRIADTRRFRAAIGALARLLQAKVASILVASRAVCGDLSLFVGDCDEYGLGVLTNRCKGVAFCVEIDQDRRAKREMTTLCLLTASVLDHLTKEPGHRKRADGI